jgi:hypothetical protein
MNLVFYAKHLRRILGEPARELTVLDTLPVDRIPATLKKSHT